MDTMEQLLLDSKQRLAYLTKKYFIFLEEKRDEECKTLVREIGVVSRGIKKLKEEIQNGQTSFGV